MNLVHRPSRFGQAVLSACRRQWLKVSLLGVCVLGLLGLEAWGHFAPVGVCDWTADQLRELRVSNTEDFHFVAFGDNEGSAIVKTILDDIQSDPEVSFALDIGDLVRAATRKNYRDFVEQVRRRLKRPLLTAIGNRDMAGHDDGLYRKVFGPLYYTFHVGRNAFIVLDDADGRGLGRAQTDWLEKELAGALEADARFVLMHVPLFDRANQIICDCLSEEESERLVALFRRYRVTYVFAAHIHGYFAGNYGGVPYVVTGGGGGDLDGNDPGHYFYNYLKIGVCHGHVDVRLERIPLSPVGTWLEQHGCGWWVDGRDLLGIRGLELALVMAVAALVPLIVRTSFKGVPGTQP